jgi:hypothetical protein
MTNETTVGDVGRIVALGRDGKPRIRQQPCNLSFEDRVKNYRRRIGLAEPRKNTFQIFPIMLPRKTWLSTSGRAGAELGRFSDRTE